MTTNHAPRRAPSSRRPIDGGFTIVELLVAMAVAGILISLIFAVYTRMSVAYQAQNRVTAVIQNLRAGQDRLVRELRMAGAMIPQPNYRPIPNSTPGTFSPGGDLPPTAVMHNSGVNYNGVKVASTVGFGVNTGYPLQPVYITNGGSSVPDQIRFFYADQATGAKVETITLAATTHLDLFDHDTSDSNFSATSFAPGDLVLLVNTTQEQISMDVAGDGAFELFEVTGYEACLLQVTGIISGGGQNRVSFGTVGPPNFNEHLGLTPASHCSDVLTQHNADLARPAAARSDSMLYKLIGRSYRIDPSRPELGVLQVHNTGELTNPTSGWEDLGIGFTNLQVATQWYDSDSRDQDGDGDDAYDWYSKANQEFDPTFDPLITPPGVTQKYNTAVLARMTLTLEARSFAEVDTPSTTVGPYLGGGSGSDHLEVGDSPGLTVPSANPRYTGSHVYRWLTMNFEFRNMARGF